MTTSFFKTSTLSGILVSSLVCSALLLPASHALQEATPVTGSSTGTTSTELPEERDTTLIHQAGTDVSAEGQTKGLGEAMAKVREFPNDPKAHFELAMLYSRSNYLMDALKEVKTARNLLIEQDDPAFITQTIANYEKQAKKNPKLLLSWYRLGLAYYLQGYALEKTKYGAKLQAAATQPPAFYYGKAKSNLQKALSINPRDTYTKNYLGYITFENDKNAPAAIQMWKESVSIEPKNNMAAYFLLANAYKKSGDFANSLIYGAKALEIQSRLGALPKS
jgi:tetratricopeptide (TPR) repeat protein